jgi:hypothetical protein
MGVSKRRNRSVVGLLALVAAAIFLLPASQAAAATIPNACVNSAQPETASSIPVTMTATASPNPVAEGGSVTLSEIKQELAVPANVFLTGYGLGLLKAGVNEVPVKVTTQIAATNTVQGTQATNIASGLAVSTIKDPDGIEGNKSAGEEATAGVVKVSYENQTWTAAASGTIEFRELTVKPLEATKAGITLVAELAGGTLKVKFGCDPGNVVEGANVSTITLTDPAPAFASTSIENKAPKTSLKSTKIKDHKVTFKFSSNEKGSTFLCKLDKKQFAKCKSPKTYKNLKPGKHKFQVKARDNQGKLDQSPAVKKFTIKK